jgi:hypothetical protein
MLRKISAIFGILFLATGILGFFPNPVIGPEGIFLTDLPHNIVHLALGLILLIGATASSRAAGRSMKIVAGIYLILAIAGFVQFGGEDDRGLLLGMTLANSADNWLHIALAALIYLSYRISRDKEAAA